MPDIKKGSTDVTRYVVLRDSTAGTPETGYTITALDLQYTRNRTAPVAKVDAVALAATDTAHTDNRAIEVDATSSPGLYRIDWPDAAFATGADKVILVVSGSGLDPAVEEISLVNYDSQDVVRLGLTALPNAAADAAGGLPISDAGGLDLDAQVVTKINSILEDTGTTLQAEIDGVQADTEDIQARLPAALVNSRMDCTIDGTGMETGAVDSILNRDASGSTTNSTLGAIVNDWENGGRLDLIVDDILADTAEIGTAGAGLTNINLPNQTMDIVGNITGNLSGSVGSVTGAVGSVTGAVGSVTGAVGSVAAGGITAASIATDAIDADALADGAITAATFAAGAIDAAAIATNAIGSDELAASAITEIQSGLSTLTAADIQTALVNAGLVLNSTTIATLASQTSFTLTAGSDDNDAYNDAVIVITDQSTATQKAVAVIDDYTGSTKTVTLRADPAIFTMATGDLVDILPCRALKPTVPLRTLDVTTGGEAGVDWANVGTPGATVNLSATTVNLTNTLTTYTGNTPQTGDSYAIVSSGTFGNSALNTDLDSLLARLTAARAGYLDNINNANLASVPAFPSNFASLGINASGHVSRVVLNDTTTTNTDMLTQANVRTAVGLATANLDTQLDALPTNAELATALAAADDAVLAAIAALNNLSVATVLAGIITDHGSGSYIRNTEPLDAAGTRSAVGLASANLDTQLDAIPTNAELATALAAADDAVLAAIAALNNLSSAGVSTAVTTALTTALTEGYRSANATGSVRDLLYEVIAHLGESSISGTTKTLKKVDGSTTAKTYTLNSSTVPTSITETT